MLNKKESIILYYLRNNARKSITKISKETGIPITTTYDIINRLKKKNIIDKYVTLIDFKKAGFKIRANITLKANNKTQLLDFLLRNPNINSIHRVIDYDFLVDAIFLNLADYKLFKENIKKFELTKIKEHYLKGDIKREGANII